MQIGQLFPCGEAVPNTCSVDKNAVFVKIRVYQYFAVGSRSHFCVIPVDEETISNYQEAGTEIRQQYYRHDN